MSWAFSIGDFLIADPTTEIPARAQEERKVELRPQNGPRLSEQHLPPINKEKRKEREREREREELDWQKRWLRSLARSLSRRLIIDGVICLKTDALRSLLGIGS